MQNSAKGTRVDFATPRSFGELHPCEGGSRTACDAIAEVLMPTLPLRIKSETNVPSRISARDVQKRQPQSFPATNPWRWERRAF
jgi:hypothetical protein